MSNIKAYPHIGYVQRASTKMQARNDHFGSDESIAFINKCSESLHCGALHCEQSRDGRGRILRAKRQFKKGDTILVEQPLHQVEAELENAAYTQLEELCTSLELPYGPLWYWCALQSLTLEDLQSSKHPLMMWTPLDAEDQSVLLRLYYGGVSQPTEHTRQFAATFLGCVGEEVLLKFERCLQVWLMNAFESQEYMKTVDRESFTIYFFPSLLNHSCWPNGMWSYKDAAVYELKARRDINVGEEVTISYLGEASLLKEATSRIHTLFGSKNFLCGCSRCTDKVDRSRGMRCRKCHDGVVFAKPPTFETAMNQGVDENDLLRPLRPSVYFHQCADNVELWLTIGAPALRRAQGRFYYEVRLGRMVREPQIGWALDAFELAENWTGAGIGDDIHSWAADGQRQKCWHDGPCREFPVEGGWKEGDVIGCAVDIDAGEINFSTNGLWSPSPCMHFDAGGRQVYPAISAQGEFEFIFHAAVFHHDPPSADYKAMCQPHQPCPVFDRWSPLQTDFVDASCSVCGYEVDVCEARRLLDVERSARRNLMQWRERDPTLNEVDVISKTLSTDFVQHALAEQLRKRLSRYHRERNHVAAYTELLAEQCDFPKKAYPGPCAEEAFLLEAYADALASNDQSRSNDVQLSLDTYAKSLGILILLFGDNHKYCMEVADKVASVTDRFNFLSNQEGLVRNDGR